MARCCAVTRAVVAASRMPLLPSMRYNGRMSPHEPAGNKTTRSHRARLPMTSRHLTLGRCAPGVYVTQSRPSALNDTATSSDEGHHAKNEGSSSRDESGEAEDDDEAKFVAWLQSELEASPAAAAYPELMSMEGCGAAVLFWRRRYRGNARLWKRLFKRDRVLKEIEETAPIIDRALRWVSSRPEGSPPVTVVDLCSGKGYLGMLLSELLSPEKVERIVLVDKAWPTCGAKEVLPHHINWDHIYGETPESEYFHTWPIRIVTSKQNIKKGRTLRAMATEIFDRAQGPVMILAVHLCGTLSLRAVDLFNNNCDSASVLMLKPCCLPYAQKDEVFTIGSHSFPADEVKGSGKYVPHSISETRWRGPPRWQLKPRFDRWAGHLSRGVEPGGGGRVNLLRLCTDQQQGYQNAYIMADREPSATAAVDICRTTPLEQAIVANKVEKADTQ